MESEPCVGTQLTRSLPGRTAMPTRSFENKGCNLDLPHLLPVRPGDQVLLPLAVHPEGVSDLSGLRFRL